ncbi:MAG TPA: class I SAM-dependent methyltransferase [Rhizomicrobium sp.]
MKPIDAGQKLRGGYYTSPAIARWLCTWAIRSSSETVLEPSCGAGEFLVAAVDRLTKLGTTKLKLPGQVTGVEILAAEAETASSRIRTKLGRRSDIVRNEDFFAWWLEDETKFDVVVGNPPFIRYQSFQEPCRTHAMAIMKSLGLSPNRLTNSWVPFVVAATARLQNGGRMALVLPAELLQVSYAAQLRSFLAGRFERIDVIACNELFFDNAEQEVVLLLADNATGGSSRTNTCRVAMTETSTVSEIIGRTPRNVLKTASPKELLHDSEKWLKYFLSEREIALMRELRQSENVTSLATHASVDVGVVTGKNEFFVLTNDQVMSLGLEQHTTPLVSRSAQLKGSRIGTAEWKRLSAAGARVHLLNISQLAENKSTGLQRYIRDGEQKNYHQGYKCSIRTPWYIVPSAWVPDAFMFRQIYDFPRIVLNSSGATSTDTIHRFRSRTGTPERTIANTYTWLTGASAEIEGRSYGGGVLELEPTEAERVLMPAKLNGAMPMPECDRLVRAGRLDDILEENAGVVLRQHLGLSRTECLLLRDIWAKMRDRRLSRKRARGEREA